MREVALSLQLDHRNVVKTLHTENVEKAGPPAMPEVSAGGSGGGVRGRGGEGWQGTKVSNARGESGAASMWGGVLPGPPPSVHRQACAAVQAADPAVLTWPPLVLRSAGRQGQLGQQQPLWQQPIQDAGAPTERGVGRQGMRDLDRAGEWREAAGGVGSWGKLPGRWRPAADSSINTTARLMARNRHAAAWHLPCCRSCATRDPSAATRTTAAGACRAGPPMW